MREKFQIGLFTSAWDKVAWDLVAEVCHNVQKGFIPESEIAFVFCSRETGETHFGDLMISNVRNLGVPLITFSSLKFQPELRRKGREAEKQGDFSIINTWRLAHDHEVAKLISSTDLDILLGYMWVVGEEMCQERTMINLHPALPSGPKGTYREVIWKLIRDRASRTGVMMHLVTPELDMGPPIAYCSFSIQGKSFNPLWEEMEKRLKRESLEQIAEGGEDNPLFKEIRKKGVIREFPMVIWTIKIFAERRIKIGDGRIFNWQGQVLEDGYDLTAEINAAVKEEV